MDPARGPRRAFGATVAVLAAYNITRAFGVFAGWEMVAALLLAALVVGIGYSGGLRPGDLGLRRADAGRGLRWGAAAASVVAVVIIVAALVPATRGFLDDARGDRTGAELVGEIIVGILVTTVIPEELAFRGVLLGAGLRMWASRTAMLVTAVLFGLWHIAPTLHTADGDNALAASGVAVVGSVVAAVAATTAAGAVFAWLRLRSRSLAAPVLAHLATNAVALTAAWVVRG